MSYGTINMQAWRQLGHGEFRGLIIMVGPSGSGKSTLAKWLRTSYMNWVFRSACPADRPLLEITSADKYLYRDGEYQFDPMLLGKAHGACFRETVTNTQMMKHLPGVVIVDNTNLSVAEIAPYMSIHQAYGLGDVGLFGVQTFIMPKAEEGDLASRNVHGVPEGVISKMVKKREKLIKEWPMYWPAPLILGNPGLDHLGDLA